MHKMKRLIIAGIVALVVVVIIGFYISDILPFYIVGSPTPLFIIYNKDVNNSHEVVIEIFNSHDESVFKETYKLSRNETIKRPKPSIWMKNPRLKEEYTFKVVLDNETMKIHKTEVGPWTTPLIYIYPPLYKDSSGEMTPIFIKVAVV